MANKNFVIVFPYGQSEHIKLVGMSPDRNRVSSLCKILYSNKRDDVISDIVKIDCNTDLIVLSAYGINMGPSF